MYKGKQQPLLCVHYLGVHFLQRSVLSRYYSCMETACVGASAQTLHVGAFDHARVQVSPVESMVHIINGQSVGPAHFIHQGRDGAAIHVGPGYTRSTAPFCPVHVAVETKHCFCLGHTWASYTSLYVIRVMVVSGQSVFFFSLSDFCFVTTFFICFITCEHGYVIIK